MDSADPRACARPSSSPARRSKGAQKKRGLAVAVEEEEEVQTAENNQVCDRLPLPPEYGQEPGREHRHATLPLGSSACSHSERTKTQLRALFNHSYSPRAV